MRHFLDNARREIHELVLRRQKHRIETGIELVVDERHLELMLKIGKRPQAFDHHAAILLARKLGKQTARLRHGHVRNVPCDTADELDALFG